MKLPLRTFWSYNRQIDRIRAERDQRTFRLLITAAAQSKEPVTALVESLRLELDSPVVVEKKFDEAKFDELRDRFASGKS
ncbi:hypothetical protein [Sphingomonas sp. NFR04]|uniref:hypothetical protein n=1 Tax=Sphingomonas sp. NFR04 TaxID=1566283 RepID=UPI0011144250|nr:hypothetical protein [Sphingomonas sp. NFR04]